MSAYRATILVVEDELLIRWAIIDFLQESGFRTVAASDAEEAVRALENANDQIDLVFSDIRMPGAMDGFGLAAWLTEHRPNIGVVLTSGHAQGKDSLPQLGERFGEIVKKPYEFEDVRRRIEAAIRRQAQRGP